MTMRDIAKQLGISVATVSRALNNHENVNEETKKKVLALVKELNYTPNAIARNLSKNENNNIAFLVPDLENMFFAKLVSSVCRYFYKKGYQVTVYSSAGIERKEKDIIQAVIQQRIGSVIAIPTKSFYEENPYLEFAKHGIHCILLDREIENSSFGGIFMDNFRGAYLLTEKLIKEGHKKISFVSGDVELKTARDRLEGFLAAMKDKGIPVRSEDIYFGDFGFESGVRAGKLIRVSDTSAVFAANNQMFVGILKEIEQIPRKFRLCSFDNIDVLENIGYDFLTLDFSIENLNIARELLRLVQSRSDEQIYLEPNLKI